MNQLIAINTSSINNEVKQTVNARDLHGFLGNKDHFATWIKDRIEQFGFVENQDFVTYSENPEKGRPSKEYALTLEMGKELSMVERNDKGKQARLYFIDCEKRAHNPMAVLNDPALMRNLLLTYTEKVLTLENRVDELAPKAAVADRLNGAAGNMNIRNAAKALKMKEGLFVKWLQENKWIFRNKKGRLEGYATHIPRYIEHKTTIEVISGEEDRVYLQVMITPVGLSRLANIFNVEAEVYQKAA